MTNSQARMGGGVLCGGTANGRRGRRPSSGAPGPSSRLLRVTGHVCVAIRFSAWLLSRVTTGAAVLDLPPAVEWAAPSNAPAAPGDAFPVVFRQPPTAVASNAPVIAEWNRTAMPGESLTLAGVRFSTLTGAAQGADTTVWVWAPQGSDGILTQARVWSVSEFILTATLPDDIPFGLYLLWVENRHGASAPVCLNRTQPEWIGPLGSAAQTGGVKRVFGKNLSHDHGTTTAYVYLQPAAGGPFLPCAVSNVEPYAVAFAVPADAAPGAYRVFVHNGHGGAYGWGDPLDLTLTNAWARGTNEIAVPPSGGDDRPALQAAIDTLTALPAGGTVRLSNGVYTLSRQLDVKANVRLLGAGMTQTTVEIRFTVAGQHSGVRFYGNHVTLEDLTLKVCESTYLPGYGIFNSEWPGTNQDVVLSRVCWTAETHVGCGNMGLRTVRGEVAGCVGYRGLGLGRSDLWVHDCVFHGGPYGGPDVGATGAGLSGDACARLVVERNRFETDWPVGPGGNRDYLEFVPATNLQWMIWCKRLITLAINYGSTEHSYIAWNVCTNVASEENQGEMILLHGATAGRITNWYGQVVSNAGQTLTVRTDGLVGGERLSIHGIAPGTNVPDGMTWGALDHTAYVLIAGGTGLGQARRIAGHTADTITVETPWRVPPAEDSRIILLNLYIGHIQYRNELNAFPDGYTNLQYSASCGISYWENCFGNVAEGNVSRRTFSSRVCWAVGVSPSYWNEMRDEHALETWYMGDLLYCSAAPSAVTTNRLDALGPWLLGNMIRGGVREVRGPWLHSGYRVGMLQSVVSIYPTPPGTPYCDEWLARGNVYENVTACGSRRGFEEAAWCTTLLRGNTLTVTNVPLPDNNPPEPQPVFIRALGRPLLSGNTYAGAATDYHAEDAASLRPEPVALHRVARFSPGVGRTPGDVVIPVANAGAVNMEWSVSETDAWFSATPARGAPLAAESEAGQVVVRVPATNLSAGLHWSLFALATAGTQAEVGVSANVLEPPASGLRVWLRADAGLMTNADESVSAWADQSGHGNDVTAPAASNQPLSVDWAISGRPCVRFRGDGSTASDGLARPSVTLATATGLALVVAGRLNVPASHSTFLQLGTNPSPLHVRAAGDPDRWEAMGFGSSNALGARFRILQAEYVASNQTARLFEDGFPAAAVATNLALPTEAVLTLGAGQSSSSAWDWAGSALNGDLAEVLIYDRPLADAERAALTAYLQDAYAEGALGGDFTLDPSRGVEPLSVTFTPCLWGTNTEAAIARWDFDNDGQWDRIAPGTAAVATTYAVWGTYSVAQALTNPAGDAATAFRYACVEVYPTVTNVPPTHAGKAQTVNVLYPAYLHGTLDLGGQPTSLVATAWSLFSGPGTAAFADPSALDTQASFSLAGTYVLRLTTTYLGSQVFDYVTVTVLDGNTTNGVPFEESFESYERDAGVVGVRGWYGGPRAGVVTTGAPAPYAGACPIPGDHTLLMQLDGAVTNRLVGPTNRVVWFDLLFRWVSRSDFLPEPTGGDAHYAFYTGPRGRLTLWHADLEGRSNRWTELDHAPVGTGEWVRLTVKGDYGTLDAIHTARYYQVSLNGVTLTHAAGYTRNDGAGGPGGAWFPMAVPTSSCTAVTLQGAVLVDDFVVTDADPGRVPPKGSLFLTR